MKKIILLFAAISTVLVSCQSDDDAGPSDTLDKFIGVWKITQEFEDGVEVTLDACTLEDTLTVTNDQKFNETTHNIENGTCILEETIKGEWVNLGNNTYRLKPDLTDAEEIKATITFSGNTMTIVINDEDAEYKRVLTRS